MKKIMLNEWPEMDIEEVYLCMKETDAQWREAYNEKDNSLSITEEMFHQMEVRRHELQRYMECFSDDNEENGYKHDVAIDMMLLCQMFIKIFEED